MIELSHKGIVLKCELEKYDYAHGLGVTAIFYSSGSPTGKVRFLCDKSDEKYSMVSECSDEEITFKIEQALKANIYEELLSNMHTWQSKIESLGHNTLSLIYGKISNAF